MRSCCTFSLFPQTVIKSEWWEISGKEQLRGAEQLGLCPSAHVNVGARAAMLAFSLLQCIAGTEGPAGLVPPPEKHPSRPGGPSAHQHMRVDPYLRYTPLCLAYLRHH